MSVENPITKKRKTKNRLFPYMVPPDLFEELKIKKDEYDIPISTFITLVLRNFLKEGKDILTIEKQ